MQIIKMWFTIQKNCGYNGYVYKIKLYNIFIKRLPFCQNKHEICTNVAVLFDKN